MEVAMPRTRRKRHTYTPQQRTTILAAARKEGLTAAQVQKKYGVTPVTYYSWRKKSGLAARRGGVMVGTAGRGAALTGQVRAVVQTRVRRILPIIVRNEVSAYLNELFLPRRGRRVRT